MSGNKDFVVSVGRYSCTVPFCKFNSNLGEQTTVFKEDEQAVQPEVNRISVEA